MTSNASAPSDDNAPPRMRRVVQSETAHYVPPAPEPSASEMWSGLGLIGESSPPTQGTEADSVQSRPYGRNADPNLPYTDDIFAYVNLKSFERLAERCRFFDIFSEFRIGHSNKLRLHFEQNGDKAALKRLDNLRVQLTEARAYERIHGIGSLMKRPMPPSQLQLDYVNLDVDP